MNALEFDRLQDLIPEKIVDIQTKIEDYLKNSSLDCLVLGVSGGIDSTLVACICQPVLSALGMRLHGYSLPIQTNKEDEISRATLVGNAFCDSFDEVDLLPEYETLFSKLILKNSQRIEHFRGRFNDPLMRHIMIGNIKARTRMIYLYNEARMMHGAVLSTDNMTEYMLGFWTIMGDEGDISPIQLYYKTEVYAMARELSGIEVAMANIHNDTKYLPRAEAINQCILATPTDGLGITDSDLDQIGAPDYETVDRILLGDIMLSERYPKVMELSKRTVFKRRRPFMCTRL